MEKKPKHSRLPQTAVMPRLYVIMFSGGRTSAVLAKHIKENPESAKWWLDMEQKYSSEEVPRFDLRTNKSIERLIPKEVDILELGQIIPKEELIYCEVCKDELMNQVNSSTKHCVNCGESYPSVIKPKQETLEEVAKEFGNNSAVTNYQEGINVGKYQGFIEGAKWQQENILELLRSNGSDGVFKNCSPSDKFLECLKKTK